MIVHREAKRLGIADFFEGGLFGPGEDWRAFSKLAFTRSMLENANASGEELLGFGDGFVETENAKQLGRTPVGCATDATGRSGRVEEWKRSRLSSCRSGPDHSGRQELAGTGQSIVC